MPRKTYFLGMISLVKKETQYDVRNSLLVQNMAIQNSPDIQLPGLFNFVLSAYRDTRV